MKTIFIQEVDQKRRMAVSIRQEGEPRFCVVGRDRDLDFPFNVRIFYYHARLDQGPTI